MASLRHGYRAVPVAIVATISCGRIAFAPIALDGDGSCTPAAPADDFTLPAAAPCGAWGSVTLNGLDVVRGAAGLRITPNASPANVGDFGGCTAGASMTAA